MSRPKPTIKQRLEYAGLFLVFLAGSHVPRKAFTRLGAFFGRFAFSVLRVRRRVTLVNLRQAFGDSLSYRERVDLARRSYESLGSSLLEFTSLVSMNKRKLQDAVSFENLEAVDKAISGGKGCILVTAHYGSWELLGSTIVAKGYPTTFLVKEQNNPLVAEKQNLIREKGGIGIANEGPLVARSVLRAIARGHLVGILPDQDARRHGVFVNFLGRPASTYKGPAFFAYRAGVPILTVYIRRVQSGDHVATFYDPIYPDTEAEMEEEVRRMTQAYTDHMTEWILRYPEHYFWVHRRFKSHPDGGPSLYDEMSPR